MDPGCYDDQRRDQKDWTPAAIYGLASLTVINGFNFFDRTVLSLVLPLVKQDLRLSDTALGLISGLAFVIFYSLLGVPVARLADRTSRRNIIGLGFALWSVMTALTGLVVNAWQLALLRFLMGAGETTGVAPSNSMASDLVSAPQRPLALSIITAGQAVASILLLPAAGLIAQTWGWRATFMAAGAPGLVLALIFLGTVKEPPRRGSARQLADDSLMRTLRFLAGSKTYALIILSGCFMGVTIYASLIWDPTFLVRVHHFSIMRIGATVGPLRGVLGLIGVAVGGVATVRLGRLDARWQLWTPALACALVAPAVLLFLLAPTTALSLVGLGGSSLLTGAYSGLLFSACMSVVQPRMRAVSSAVFLLFGSTIGQIVGPAVVGILNDHFAPTHGATAIRYSLLIGSVCAAGSALLLYAASAYIRQDILRAEGGLGTKLAS